MIGPEDFDEEEQQEPEPEPEAMEPEPELDEALDDAVDDVEEEQPDDAMAAESQEEYESEVTGIEAVDEAAEESTSNEDGAEEAPDFVGGLAAGALAAGAAALIGEANAQVQDREARKREQEEARKAREEERAKLMEERQKEMEAAKRAREEERANRPRPSFGESLRDSGGSAPAPPPPATFAAPPAVPPPADSLATSESAPSEVTASEPEPAKTPEPVGTEASAGEAAVLAAESGKGRIPRLGARKGADANSEVKASVGDARAEREAARKAMLDSKKAEAEAKKAEREALMKQKAEERKAAMEGAASARGARTAGHASDFADLRGTGMPAAPMGGNSAMAEKMAKIAAGGGGMAQALSSKLAQAKAESAGPVLPTGPAKGPAAAPPPPGANDYLDIIQHLDVRSAMHEEYGVIRQKYESRLLVGGEVLQCTLVGLNAGLIDMVYRKLSKIPTLMELIDWKYVAIEPVIVVSENGQKRDVRVDTQAPITIGRDPSNTISLAASFVSRNHAEIRNLAKNPHLPPQWQVKDLGSTHGTTLNGSTVRDAVRFGSEDRIELGRGYAATEYPSLQLISRAIPYGRDDLNRMVVDVDLVVAVVETDREFEGQANLLRNLSDVQNVGGLFVLAVSKSGPVDPSMDANLDELRHAARVLKSTELTRYLAAVDGDEIGSDADWLEGAKEFIEGFRGRSHAGIQEKRKQITREEVVGEIRNAGTKLEATLSKKLEEAERNLQRVQDEVSMAPRNLGSAETLRDDTFKALKQTLDDDTSFFADPLRPDSLTYFADRLVRQLVLVKKGKTKLELMLVDPQSQQEPHRWLNGELSNYAKRHFDSLLLQMTGPQKEPHGITGLYQSMRELLGGHDKLRNTDMFSDDNYQRYVVSELQRQLHSALSADFVQYDAVTTTKIDNMLMFIITKTRFAVMFYMSMFSIVGVIIGSTRSKINKFINEFFGGKFFLVAIPVLMIVFYMTYRSYKVNTKEVIDDESDKLREQLSKHYQAVAKKFVEDAKRVFSIHLSTQESKIKQDMGTLGSSRMAGGLAERNNPVIDQAKKERDDVQALIYAISQERAWAEQAQMAYTPSPFVQVQPARRTPTTR